MLKLFNRIPSWVYLSTLFIPIGLYCSMGLDEMVYTATAVALLAGLYLLLFQRKILFQINLLCLPLAMEIPIAYGGSMNYPSEVIILLMFIFTFPFFISNYKEYKNILEHPISKILLIQVAWMIITSLISDMPGIGIKRCVVRCIYIYIYFILTIKYIREDPAKGRWYYVLYAVGLIIPAVVSIAFMARFNFTTRASYMAGFPFYKDHTIYGAAVAFILTFVSIITIHYKKMKLSKFSVMFWVLLSVFFFIALFLSYSRAAWLSFIAGLLYSLLLYFKIKLKYVYGVLLVLIVAVIVNWSGIYSVMRKNDSISNKDDIKAHIGSVTNLNKDASNTERINRWVCAIRMFKEKPLKGFGPGTYQFYYGEFQTHDYMTPISTFRGNKGHAHSEYLNALSEQGIAGLCILLICFHLVLNTANKLYHHSSISKVDRTVILAIVTSVITFMIHSLLNGFMETDKIAGLIFISCAILVAMDMKYKKDESQLPLTEINS